MKKSEFKSLIRREIIREAKGTSYEAKLAEIEKQGHITTLEAKIDAVAEMIEAKNNRLSLVNEDENLSELIDKKKIKEMQKEIKLLEKTKLKLEKLYEKKSGGMKKDVVVDEDARTDVEEGEDSTYEEDDIDENLTSEHQGYDDKEDESLGMEDGPEKDYTQSEKDRREDRYGKWGDRDEEHRGASLEESTNEEFDLRKYMAENKLLK